MNTNAGDFRQEKQMKALWSGILQKEAKKYYGKSNR